jgi:hypothetical protein
MPYDALDITRDLIDRAERVRARETSYCQITVTNECPADWGVVIVVGGCKFFYSDASDYSHAPKEIDLLAGQSAVFITDKPAGCVHQFFLALSVKAGDEPARPMTYQDGVPEGECLLHETITLGPKQRVAAEALNRRDVFSLIELRRG